MNYTTALNKVYAFQARGICMGLETMREALKLRGSPEKGMTFVQIAGTNGKGSVASMMAASLSAAGHKTGLFTSPHLHRYVERVRINGRPLSQPEAARRIENLVSVFGTPHAPQISFFEFATLLAIETFRDKACDIALLEVGLGGRLDSTTAAPAILSVITTIALDHMNLLGETTHLIAREKAGIIRRGVPLVVGRCDAAARRAIGARARGLNAPAIWADRDFQVLPNREGTRFDVRVEDRFYRNLKLRLPGDHQVENAACAIAGLDKLKQMGFEVPDTAIRKAFSRLRWPGRLERIAGKPDILFDTAHNADGCRSLVSHIEKHTHGAQKRVLVFGAMSDKNYRDMLRVLAPRFHKVFFTKPRIDRAASFEELTRIHPGTPTRGLEIALNQARRAAGANGLVVITGSIFLVAEARAALLNIRSDPLIRM
jgi:dihydrofolate synthase/folylpolyglutamate synthase